MVSLSATLFVKCKGSSCKLVMDKAKSYDGFTTAFRVDKEAKEHGADVIIHLKVHDKEELLRIGQSLLKEVHGVAGLQPVIEVAS